MYRLGELLCTSENEMVDQFAKSGTFISAGIYHPLYFFGGLRGYHGNGLSCLS